MSKEEPNLPQKAGTNQKSIGPPKSDFSALIYRIATEEHPELTDEEYEVLARWSITTYKRRNMTLEPAFITPSGLDAIPIEVWLQQVAKIGVERYGLSLVSVLVEISRDLGKLDANYIQCNH